MAGQGYEKCREHSQGSATHLSLLGKPVHFLQSSPGNTPFENAVVLFGIHVEWLLVHGSIILDLIYRRIRLSHLLGLLVLLRGCLRKMILKEEVGRMRNGSCGWREAW